MVGLIWLATAVMALGGLVALSPVRRPGAIALRAPAVAGAETGAVAERSS
jgi:hypothetical protein